MSRRVKVLGVALLSLLAFRACLPLAIEMGIELAGDRAVDGTVEVDDVDLGLLVGYFAIEGLRVDRHALEDEAAPPIATLARLAVNAAPSALLAGRVHVEEIVVEGGALRLERSDAGDLVLPLSDEARAAILGAPPDVGADLLPLPLRVDVARFSDLHALVHDPVEDVDSASFDLASLELDDLRVEGRRAILARIALVAPAALLDRGLLDGPRAMFREPEPEAAPDLEVALATQTESSPVAAGPPARDAGSELSPPAAGTGPPPTPIDARIAALSIEDARLTWVDRTHDPAVREEATGFSLAAHDLAWSDEGLSNLQVEGRGLRGEPFELTGSPGEDGGLDFHLVAKEFDLTPFGPYATEITGYEVRQGRVSIDSKVKFAFPQIDSVNGLVLDDLRLRGEGYLENSLGTGANLAIALLSGPDGRIHLNVPVRLVLDEEATRLALEELEGAMQEAMQRSLGGVGSVEEGSGLRIEPLRSPAGEPALEGGQDDRLRPIVKLLREKPGVAVVLRGRTSDGDVAALAGARGVAPDAVSEREREALADGRAAAAIAALAGLGVPASQLRLGAASTGPAPGVALQLALAE